MTTYIQLSNAGIRPRGNARLSIYGRAGERPLRTATSAPVTGGPELARAVATLSLDFLASPAIGCATRTRRFQLTIAASFGGCDGAAASFWQHVGPEALLAIRDLPRMHDATGGGGLELPVRS